MYVCIKYRDYLKKIVLLILIFVILFNIGGYVGLYELLKYSNYISIEKQINQGTSKENFVILSFPLKSLKSGDPFIQWTRAGKEFDYNKNRYDLVAQTIKNDTIYYYCIHDTKEEQILLSYKAAVQKNTDNTSNRKNSPVFPKIIIDYYCQSIDKSDFHNISIPIFYSYLQFYRSYSIELPSPPPKNLI